MSRYRGALEAARETQAQALFQLSRRIDTSRNGEFSLVVFNPLSFARTEVVRYAPTFMQLSNLMNQEVRNFRIVDPSGKSVPLRVLAVSPREALASTGAGEQNKSLVMAAVEFEAANVPAFGYRVYRIEPMGGDPQLSPWRPVQGRVSSQFFEIRIDPAKGSISELVDRRTGEELLGTHTYGGNELLLEEEKDPNLEGGIHFTGGEIRSDQFRPSSITARTDALGTEVRIQGPFMGGRRIQRIALYNDLLRIAFTTELTGFPGHDGILTVVFPLSRRAGSEVAYETNNAVTIRPDGIYDAHTWIDVSSPSGGGVAIVNQGTGGHQIAGDTIRMMLLRSVTDYRGYYSPRASEADDPTFEYALYPHPGEWNNHGVVEQAHSFNSPLRVLQTDSHVGSLPLEFSFLSVQEGHFEATALKQAEDGDGLILRGHETQGKTSHVRIHVELPVQSAWFTNLLEHRSSRETVHNGDIEFDCQAFEFVTLRLRKTP